MLINKFFLRILILLVIPLALTLYFSFYFIPNITRTSLEITNLVKAKQDQNACFLVYNDMKKFTDGISAVKDKEKELSSLLKLPGDLFRYNLYLKNNIKAKTEDARNVDTTIRININGNYKEITSGKNKKILNNFETSNSIDKFEYSFMGYYEDTKEEISENARVSLEKSIDLYLKPEFFVSLFIFMFLLATWYGILLLLSGFYKFIAFGEPFCKGRL
ncbi:MAG: hypothetical protein Q7S78_02575 [Candidatus Azambacteria bacterium]|nr:hypothetical protein [Candidatus Azambacteria bacterium]